VSERIDKLKQVFREAPEIKASSEAKQAAISAAMAAFAEEKATNHQGNDIDSRLNGQDDKNIVLATFSRWRESMKLKYLLPGAAALATVTLVAVNTTQFESLHRPHSPEADDILVAIENEATPELRGQENTAGSLSAEISSSNLAVEEHTRAVVDASRLKRRVSEKKHQQEIASTIVSTGLNPMATQVAKTPYDFYAVLPKGDETAYFPIDGEDFPVDADGPGDRFEQHASNPLRLAQDTPVSTFSIDVDTASYGYLRASLNRGRLPEESAVRIEELINYFPYDYPVPVNPDVPFSLNTTVIATPWNVNTRLLHVGIRGYELMQHVKPKANLVFLIDSSGSMSQPDKLPLLISSFKLLLSTLDVEDTVSIVSYAGSAGTVLEPTKAANRATIINALSKLQAGGSTAGGEGIELAYQLAQQGFEAEGINRVILATDGDFNVGISDPEQLKQYIKRKRESGVFLSVLGFGMGNYHDALMQSLAQNGNGNAAYIDSLSEARKVLVDEASSTLFPIANDVKIQLEFNPAVVSEYRLIGYETRRLIREDFNNDKVDAGDIGSGHTVTAIYEITPVDSDARRVDALRYQDDDRAAGSRSEYAYLKLRYKLPGENQSHLIERPISYTDRLNTPAQTSDDVRFSVAVAAYGQLLKGNVYMENYTYDDVIALALDARGEDQFGYRNEFISLVRTTQSLSK